MSDYGGLILGITTVTIFLIVLGFLAFLRYLRYKETIVLAEKGLLRAQEGQQNGKDSLRWGIIITALGLALSIGVYTIGFGVRNNYPLQFGPWMMVGLIPTFFGVALILIYVLTRDKTPAP
jgi:hypothetical protein